jgi:ubiquinone/menaquinone biosynthesis C-methylase UbiE
MKISTNQSARLTEAVQRFGIAPYWPAYKPGVPDEVIKVLVGAANRHAEAGSLLDLGTGTGQAVRSLHPYFRDIIAVEPVRDLLDLAERELRPLVAPGTRLRLVHAPAEDFTPPEGWTASLATICRAFHWMDQPLVLERLARIVPVTGVVAIFRDRSFWRIDPPWEGVVDPWKDAVRTVVLDFIGRERERPRPDGSPFRDRPYSEILAESPFNDVEEITVPVRRTWTSESILGYLYSTSFAARPLFGDRVDAFEREVRRVLAEYSDDDTFAEDEEFFIWLGRKRRR